VTMYGANSTPTMGVSVFSVARVTVRLIAPARAIERASTAPNDANDDARPNDGAFERRDRRRARASVRGDGPDRSAGSDSRTFVRACARPSPCRRAAREREDDRSRSERARERASRVHGRERVTRPSSFAPINRTPSIKKCHRNQNTKSRSERFKIVCMYRKKDTHVYELFSIDHRV